MFDNRITTPSPLEVLRKQLPDHYRNRLTFTPSEVSALLGISIGRVLRLVRDGHLLAKTVNRTYLIDRDSLLRWTQEEEPEVSQLGE